MIVELSACRADVRCERDLLVGFLSPYCYKRRLFIFLLDWTNFARCLSSRRDELDVTCGEHSVSVWVVEVISVEPITITNQAIYFTNWTPLATTFWFRYFAEDLLSKYLQIAYIGLFSIEKLVSGAIFVPC